MRITEKQADTLNELARLARRDAEGWVEVYRPEFIPGESSRVLFWGALTVTARVPESGPDDEPVHDEGYEIEAILLRDGTMLMADVHREHLDMLRKTVRGMPPRTPTLITALRNAYAALDREHGHTDATLADIDTLGWRDVHGYSRKVG